MSREADQHIVNIDSDAPIFALTITFPTAYTDEDKDAIWDAIRRVEDERGLVEKLRKAR